jgi:hypothetical protein
LAVYKILPINCFQFQQNEAKLQMDDLIEESNEMIKGMKNSNLGNINYNCEGDSNLFSEIRPKDSNEKSDKEKFSWSEKEAASKNNKSKLDNGN